ncbi:MAG: DNA gyrase subunit A [Saprospiraceae bacterium]|nr:DNA gyrase subunit A [Saprospiraceae bacterium]
MSESRVIQVSIEDHMKSAYIDYAMSVIVSRALPDVRDGLKPVHRRVLFGMNEMGMSYNKAHKKAARIVGDVLGKYHPHGDTSVYDALVRMAQDWSLRYPLIDGQGNFGSIEGDSAAAMRYTEARMRRLADEMLSDIDKNTVDFQFNYDDTLEEPTVLPAKFPNLLVNGAEGIAVGMATRMMPHNMREVIDGTVAMIDNPAITVAELMQFIKAPDFPTGGVIYGTSGIKEAYETGRGRVVVRGRADIKNHNGRESIIINEVPYQINPAVLVQKIEELAVEKKIEGISEVRNESNKEGIRLVIEVKRDGAANIILNQLYKMTPLQSSYGINNVVLVNGRPQLLNLQRLIEEFIKFRLEVIVRRTQFELKKAQDRAHILEGLYIALDDLDRIIELIRAAKTPDEAQQSLMATTFNLSDAVAQMVLQTEGGTPSKTYNLSEVQAKAILEMRLQRLTGLERDKIKHEYDELRKHILHLNAILGDEVMRRDIIKTELKDIRDRYGDERKTEIELQDGDISIADMIEVEEVVVTISHLGYIKRIAVSEFKAQNRGGRGSRGTKTRNEDFVEHMFVANTHDYLLFFTEKGKCHWLRTYEISEGTKTSAGRVIQNILSIPADDKVRAYVKIKDLTDVEFAQSNFIIFATKQGLVKKTSVEHFTRPRNGGITAIAIREDDELLEAKLTNGNCQIMLANRNGRTIRFPESRVRPMLRSSTGVAGLELDEDGEDRVTNMISVEADDELTSVLVVSENGIGKRSSVEAYRLVNNRGGRGVSTMQVSEKTGKIVALKAVRDTDDLIITTKVGITIRMAASDIRVQGRATQGVRIIRLDEGEEIADVAVVRDFATEDAEIVDSENTENVVATLTGVENTEGVESDTDSEETTDEATAETEE